jgi:hypothetical protein
MGYGVLPAFSASGAEDGDPDGFMVTQFSDHVLSVITFLLWKDENDPGKRGEA